ncbi:MAG: hypothetical protein JWO40_163 [Candidatus Doudnabacteria bacterium]|nr:hypothetical protein [Candidatus Doudnabacteria bacterium]
MITPDIQIPQPSVNSGSLRGLGSLLAGSLNIYKNKLALFLSLSLISLVPYTLASLLYTLNGFIYLAGAVIAVAFFFIGQGGIYFAAKNYQSKISIGQALNFGLKKSPYYLWTMILSGLLSSLGFVLFIIPGLILSTWFAFAPAILVDEDIRGTRAILKSKYYVQNFGMAIFGRIFCVGFLIGILSFLEGLLTKGLSGQLVSILDTVLAVLTLPLFAIFTYELYTDVKARKNSALFQSSSTSRALIIIGAAIGLIVLVVLFILRLLKG